MKRTVIAMAIAGAFGAPLLAFAADGSEVKLFGRVQAEYSSTKVDVAGTSTNNYRQEAINDNAGQSRWCMDISEDLGNGLKA